MMPSDSSNDMAKYFLAQWSSALRRVKYQSWTSLSNRDSKQLQFNLTGYHWS